MPEQATGAARVHCRNSPLPTVLRAASTARDVQLEAKAKGTPWMISKSYDCFAPVSKFIPKTEVPDCHNLDLWMTVNGKMIQKGNTKMMIHTVG